MKKMININFQGRIIPIEETSFEILKHYTESLRVYFAHEEGRDEIINDIESRIAELFSERLKQTACITDEDVNNIISGMGRPEDFEEAEATGNYNNGPSGTGTSASPKAVQEEEEPKVWRRAINESILGGVCGGIANYVKIDPAIVRILFALIAVGSFGFWVLVYIVLWIILPARVMTPNARKRFYRSTEYRVAGGVAGGLAAYFGVDVWIPRIIFVSPLLLFALLSIVHLHDAEALMVGVTSTCVIVYVILWIILPEARSASAKLEMKGEKVNLQSIKNTVKEDPNIIIQPVKSGSIGRAIGIVFKAFFMFIAGIISLAFITAFMAILFGGMFGRTGVYPFKNYIIDTPWQNFLLWCSLILFLAVPAIALLTWFIRRIMGIRSKRHYLGYVFATLWFLGLVSAIALVQTLAQDFSVKESVEENVPLYLPSAGKLYVKVKSEASEYNKYKRNAKRTLPFLGANGDSLYLNTIRVDILQSSDSLYHVHKLYSAKGANAQVAGTRASRISYPIAQSDTDLIIPENFMVSIHDKFSNQQVAVAIEVPIGKKIQLHRAIRSFSWFTVGFVNGNWDDDDDNWDDNWRGKYHWQSDTEYVMTKDGLKKTADLEKESREKEEENNHPDHHPNADRKQKEKKDMGSIDI